jgi:cell division protein FtsB
MAHRKKRVSHAREVYYIIFIVVGCAIAAFSIWGPGGWLAMKRTRQELETRRLRIEEIERSNKAKMQDIQRLKSDPKTLEEYARRKGYGRRGEIIQQLPDKTPAQK